MMEILSDALARLEARGFRERFRAEAGGLRALGGERLFAPEDLVTEAIHRFEGCSDPEDQSILLALRTRDGTVRGTLIASFGPGIDPEIAEVIRRLPPPARRAPTPAPRKD